MAKADVLVVLFLLALTFATSNGDTTEYVSSTVSAVNTSSQDVETSLTVENEQTTLDGPGNNTSTADGSPTERIENGQTTVSGDGSGNDASTTVGGTTEPVITSSKDETTRSYVVTVSLDDGSITEQVTTSSQDGTSTVQPGPGETTSFQDGTSTVKTDPGVTTSSQDGTSTVQPVPGETTSFQDGTLTVETDPGVTTSSQDGTSTVQPGPGATTSSQDGTPTVETGHGVTTSSQDGTSTVQPGAGVTTSFQDGTSTVQPGPGETTSFQDGTSTVETGPGVTTSFQDGTSTVQPGPGVTTSSQDGTPTVETGPGVTTSFQDGTSTVQPGPEVTTSSQDVATTLTTVPVATSVADGNTVVTEQITTASSSSPSTQYTTPVIPTTTTIPPNYQLPNFDAAPPFSMTFDIGFNKSWSDNYSDENCPAYQECSSFKRVVETEINKAFENCPGYINNSVMVISFRNGSEIQRAQQRLVSSKYFKRSVEVDTQNNENNIYAKYNTDYYNAKILGDSNDDVINYIGNETVNYLENAVFDGTKALNESLQTMTEEANSQITSFTADACPTIGTYLCSTCFPCSEADAFGYTVSCQNNCSEDEICTLTSDNSPGCTCKDNYLPVAGSCVDQNIIIGVSAGVGGAILLGLIIALIVVGCRLDKKDKDYDHLLKTQEYRPSTYEMTKVHDTAKVPEYTDIDLVKHSSADHDGHAMELTTFTNVVETEDSASVAAAAVVHEAGQHSAMDNEYQQVNESEAVRKDAAQEEMKPDYDYPGVAAAVVAAKSIEPESSSHQQNKPASSDHDRYRNLYYPQANDEDDPYAGFVPRLTTVDTKTEFLITRPKIALKPASNYKDINSQFF